MSQYSPGSHAPAVKVLTYYLVIISILAVLIRLGTKWWKFRRLFLDDYYIIVSLLLSIGQSAAVSAEVNNGYGEHRDNISDTQLQKILLAEYAATLLYIPSLCFSKLSLAAFVRQLTPSPQDQIISIGIQVIIAAWGVTGIFASAFQCHPHPWDYLRDSCFNRGAWFICLGISNIVADLAVIAQAIKIIAGVQTNSKRKAMLMSVFLLRLIETGAIVARIVMIHRSVSSTEPISESWASSITTQLVQCLSILTASAAQFIPFLQNLSSSGMDLGAMTRHMASSRGQTSRDEYKLSSYELSSFGRNWATDNRKSHRPRCINGPTTQTLVTTAASRRRGSQSDPDDASQSSQARIIRKTQTFVITEERHDSMDN